MILGASMIAFSTTALADDKLTPLSLSDRLDDYEKQAIVSALVEDLVRDHRFYLEMTADMGTWEPENSGYRILARRLDLDGDSIDEVLVEIRSTASCGSGGCMTRVVQRRDGNAWKVVGELFGQEVFVSDLRTLGHSDLVVSDRSGGLDRHKWNGKAYASAD